MLSAEEFAGIVLSMRRDDFRAADKRRAPRELIRQRVRIMPCDEAGPTGQSLEVTLRDISPRGLCILYAQPMERDTQFVLAIPRAAGAAIFLLATVIHCRKGDGNLHIIGAEITCALDRLPERATARPQASAAAS